MPASGKWLRKGDFLWDSPFSGDYGQSYYEDTNGVVWHFKVRKASTTGDGSDGPPGWYHVEARPAKPATAYDVSAGRYPVALWHEQGLESDDGREFVASSIDTFVAEAATEGSGFGTLLLVLLGLYIISKDRRRYVRADDESPF